MKLLRGKEDFLEFDDIGVTEFAQGFYLSEFQAFLPTTVFLLHFFYGNNFLSLGVESLVDSSEGSVSQYFNYVIFLHPL